VKVISLFSGVGGFDLGLDCAGMETVAQVEWDKWCLSVLRRRWPSVPKWGDISNVHGSDLPRADVVSFGSPCQDLSIAGQRAGLKEGTRSGLFLEATRVVKEMQDAGNPPRWIIWENVAGALSSSKGRDFGTVLDKLAQLGAVDIQWRVLDARFFGVPQQRRRVFVVARLDPGARGGRAVLPVSPRLPGDSPASRSPEEEVAALTANGVGTCGADDNQAQAGHLIPDYVGSLTTRMLAYGSPEVDGGHYLPDGPGVRRLTPLECERLMGWPDDHTRWADDDSEIADSHRYRMCGNGVASPVAQWVGEQIVHAC